MKIAEEGILYLGVKKKKRFEEIPQDVAQRDKEKYEKVANLTDQNMKL
jgi:hypothetical protein